MGLDMYAYYVEPNSDEQHEFRYWRNFRQLHGWMEQLYRSRGGQDSFNCIQLELKKEDLIQLEKDVKSKNMPDSHGYFWGNSEWTLDDEYEIIDFIYKCEGHFDKGNKVIYDSWW